MHKVVDSCVIEHEVADKLSSAFENFGSVALRLALLRFALKVLEHYIGREDTFFI